MAARRYSDDEVQEILRVALERERDDPSGLERDEIAAAAGEIGIDAESIDRAISQLEVRRKLDAEVANMRSERLRSLFSHASTWALVNAMLFGIDWMDGGGYWFYWPLFGWGIAVVLQARRVLFADLAKDQKKAEKRIAKREKQQAELTREQKRKQAQQARAAQRKHAESKIEDAIEQGVAALLTAAANRVAASLDDRTRDQQRVASSPRARVTPDDDGDEDADEPVRRRRRF